MNKAQEGDKVTLTFLGILEDGSIFDSSDEDTPFSFIVGENEVLPGMEIAVLGMAAGEQKTVTIPPEQGYGVHRENLIDVVQIDALPEGLQLKIGDRLEVSAEDGSRFEMKIIDRDEKTVTLDANHPLAGQQLIMRIEVVSVDRPTLN